MEVKPGYRLTEVGVIPEDWYALPLEDLTPPNRKNGIVDGPFGSNLKTIHYRTSGIPIITSGYVTDGKFIAGKYLYVDRTKFLEEKRSSVRPGDIVMAKIGERCGASAILPHNHETGILSGNALKITVDESRHSTSYVWQVLWNLHVSGKLEVLRTVGAQPALSMANLKHYRLPIPPTKGEQEAIAGALSEADALLESLAQLLTKKRHLKQAAMQQLLTGQTRLQGFTGMWEMKQLEELGATYGGLTGKTKADFGEGSARYITFMNVMSNVVIDCGTFDQVKVLQVESQNRVENGDLFFNGSSETPEEVAMCAVLLEDVHDVYLNSFCFGFRFCDEAETDGLFLAYYFRSREGRELMKSLAQGSTRYNLSKLALLKASFRLPSLPEQIAIAGILSDMDGEIAALESKLAKARHLKQGMMQELLIGRTRLV
jgi:type I restriction enzyme S subunit